MDNGLEVALVSGSISAVVSVCIAVISPLFTHHLWKRQKRKEQQLAIAQRYVVLRAQTSPSLHPQLLESDQRLQFKQAQVEMKGLLFLIPILFEREEIIDRADGLLKPADTWIYFELQAFLFAEALDVPFEKAPNLVGFKP
jgi:hypothetical protein